MMGPMSQVHCDEFIPEFEKQYPEFPWKNVQVSPEQSWRGLGWPQVVSVCHLWMVLLLPPRLVTRRCGVTWRGIQGMLGTHTSTGQPPVWSGSFQCRGEHGGSRAADRQVCSM